MEEAHKNEFGSQTPNDESIKCKSIDDALSNSLILREIFTFLDDEDLGSCFHVCQDWRTVADPLVVPHFGIKLAKTINDWNGRIVGSHVSAQLANSKYSITIGGGACYNRTSFTPRTDLGVSQILKVILTQKVPISLRLTNVDDIKDDEVMDVLSKVGPLVVNLDMDGVKWSTGILCRLLLQKFPNLKKLNCSGFLPHDDSLEDQLFDTDLPRNKHKRLRKIVFGNNRFTHLFVETMLKMCENLETIKDFPLEYINAVVVARKGPALKSLLNGYDTEYYFRRMGETVVTAYKKLARLHPKLASLEFRSDGFNFKTRKLVKLFLFRLLKSSQESLELLQIAPLRSDEVQRLPTFKGLKELELLKTARGDGVFFTRKMPVKRIFPNVSKFGSSDHEWDEAFIKRHLPENVISPWGSQIIELSVNRLAVAAIPLLQRRFPSIQKLELKTSLVDLPSILLELSRLWPHLKSLTISCDYSGCDPMNIRCGRLDHAFTGLPFKVIDQLEDPSRNKNFTEEEIQGFKERSIISKLKELRELKICLSEFVNSDDNRKGFIFYTPCTYMRLSPVANEFSFSLLPELAVTLVVKAGGPFAEEMERDLKPLAKCSNIKIVNDADGYPYVFNNYGRFQFSRS